VHNSNDTNLLHGKSQVNPFQEYVSLAKYTLTLQAMYCHGYT